MKLRRRRIALGVLIVCAALLALGSAVWIAAPYFVADPLIELREKQTPVRIWRDRRGEILWHERTYDAQWRFPVPLDRISPHVARVILAAEDSSFYEHSGVDYAAVCRAAWQNLVSARRISGASTISMQLAGMALGPGRHDLRRKFLQAAMARKLERLHSKDEILAEYLNRIPFGGKIHGVEAAARYYFGLSAAELNFSEAAFLCGLPQRPNYFRPDRHLERAKERQRIVLKLLVRRGKITPEEADYILHRERVRLRDFRYLAAFESAASPGEFFPAFAACGKTRTSLDRELHFRVLSLLREQRKRLKDVRDGAALLIDNRSGEVLVYIGTLDFSAKPDGEVDAVKAVRGAGSTLKPFIYAEAVAGGMLVGATRILDAPVRYGDYSPGNYDGKFHGMVGAGYALAHSLNTPAVRLVAQLGEKRVREAFVRSGLSRASVSGRRATGLSLALGTEGCTLWNITRAYAMLAAGGTVFDPALTPGGGRKEQSERAFPPEVCLMISDMLRSRPFGHSGLDVAWKTGTSNNNCDAWCFAYTPEYTLGVWFGNKDGRRSADLVGAVAAVPVACEIFEELYRGREQPRWSDDDKVLELRELCAESGLTPGAFCRRRERHPAIPGLPLAACSTCRPENKRALQIVSPAPKQYLAASGGKAVRLQLRTGEENVMWFVNDLPIGRGDMEYEFPANARYTLRAVELPAAPDTPPRTAEVTFSVTGSPR